MPMKRSGRSVAAASRVIEIEDVPVATIFQVADYGLVADLYQALPELAQELEKRGR